MWRFKVTKFKNTRAKIPKKDEWITQIPIGKLKMSSGNHIKASCKFMAFNIDSIGGALGVLPLDASGRQSGGLTTVHGHSDFISDFDFSPFHDDILATGSYDGSVKLWKIPEELGDSLNEPTFTIPTEPRRIENVLWHPTADNILAVSSNQTVKIWDVGAEKEHFVLEGGEDSLQGMSWKGDGSMLATTSKDKMVRIFDPRQQTMSQETAGHDNIKDSRIVWLGNSDRIATTGFSKMRYREVTIRDIRQFSKALKTVEIDNSNGTLMPFYDDDTKMLFAAGKGDTTLRFFEVLDTDDVLTIEQCESMPEQIQGLSVVPKLAMNVMDAEVNRILLLAKSAIITMPYQVPRKSYTEFHADLFPETNNNIPAMTADEWIAGENKELEKKSLKPDGVRIGCPSPQVKPKFTSSGGANTNNGDGASPSGGASANIKKLEAMQNNGPAEGDGQNGGGLVIEKREVENITVKMENVLPGFRPAKFRHLKGTVSHKSTHITNIRNLGKSMPRESDGFTANPVRCAVPLTGPAGLIAVYEFSKPGRLPDGVIPTLQNGKKVTDYVWDPFDNSRLVASCDDGRIHIWRVPDGGLTTTLTEPEGKLVGHDERITFLRFHPLASEVMATGSYDGTIRVWNLKTGEEKHRVEGHTDSIFCLSWSPCGKYLVTACKDGRLRVFEPRVSSQPIREGVGPSGTQGARVLWACEGKYLVVLGYSSRSERQIFVFDSTDLSQALSRVNLDSSPLIYISYYDEDSSTLFVTSRGEGTIRAFEIGTDAPHIFELSAYKANGLHQGLSFLPKNQCDVKKVEFARSYRLTNTTVEPLIFTVPRVKKEYFQDDVFPDTKVLWEPTLTADEWFSGVDKEPRRISLKPEGMDNWSDSKTHTPKIKPKYDSHAPDAFKTPEEKKEELMGRWTEQMDEQKGPMPQDLAEGCDSDEWSDDD
ncbi:coronin-7-like isoform X2 [Lineus longissimus]|uniref:coronin-7-like isoform X2 n=1 Tax=Lineus longissimus TaxID=88925 RepID=UPI002B4D12F3